MRVVAEEGVVTGLECLRMTLGEPDASGRRRPVPEEGSNFVIPCDAVVPAIGQAVEVDRFMPAGVELGRNNTLVVDPATQQCTMPGFFAGGDCVTGPSTLVAALAAGRRAARAITEYLESGHCTPDPGDPLAKAVDHLLRATEEEAPPFASLLGRHHPAVIEPEARVCDFSEVEGCLSPPQARHEAERCLRCYRIAVAAVDQEPKGESVRADPSDRWPGGRVRLRSDDPRGRRGRRHRHSHSLLSA